MTILRFTLRALPRTALLVVLTATSASTAAGQAAVSIAANNRKEARADALHERAVGLFESPTRYREAARLLRQAAALRDADSDRGADELLLAGRLSYYANDWRNAKQALSAGAARAVAGGQLSKAANAYVDAAFSATANRSWEDAREFLRRAQRLAGSPHLQLAERDEIIGRMGPVHVAMANAGR